MSKCHLIWHKCAPFYKRGNAFLAGPLLTRRTLISRALTEYHPHFFPTSCLGAPPHTASPRHFVPEHKLAVLSQPAAPLCAVHLHTTYHYQLDAPPPSTSLLPQNREHHCIIHQLGRPASRMLSCKSYHWTC